MARLRSGRTHPATVIITALYVAFLVVAPFEHHDIICHLKSPTHCTSCASSVVGSNPGPLPTLGAAELPDAGGAIALHVSHTGFLLAVRTTGRSPPPLA